MNIPQDPRVKPMEIKPRVVASPTPQPTATARELEARVTGGGYSETENLATILIKASPTDDAGVLAAVGGNPAKAALMQRFMRDMARTVSLQSQSLLGKLLAQHRISGEQYDALLEVPLFSDYIVEAVDETEAMTPAERAKLLAAMLLPGALIQVGNIMDQASVNADAKIRALGQFIDAAGVKGNAAGGGGGGAININITAGYPGSGVAAEPKIDVINGEYENVQE